MHSFTVKYTQLAYSGSFFNKEIKHMSKRTTAPRPTAAQILAARTAAGLTQTEAAALILSTLRTWQDWEAGARRMHPGLYQLFAIKTGQIKAA